MVGFDMNASRKEQRRSDGQDRCECEGSMESWVGESGRDRLMLGQSELIVGERAYEVAAQQIANIQMAGPVELLPPTLPNAHRRFPLFSYPPALHTQSTAALNRMCRRQFIAFALCKLVSSSTE